MPSAGLGNGAKKKKRTSGYIREINSRWKTEYVQHNTDGSSVSDSNDNCERQIQKCHTDGDGKSEHSENQQSGVDKSMHSDPSDKDNVDNTSYNDSVVRNSETLFKPVFEETERENSKYSEDIIYKISAPMEWNDADVKVCEDNSEQNYKTVINGNEGSSDYENVWITTKANYNWTKRVKDTHKTMNVRKDN